MWIRQLDERLQKEFKKVPQCTRGQWGTFRLHVEYLRSRGTTRVATVVAKCWRVHKKVIHKHEEFLVSQLLHRFTHDTSCKVAPKMEGYITCSQTEDCQGPPTEFYGRYLWMLLMVCTCTRFPIILVGAWHPTILFPPALFRNTAAASLPNSIDHKSQLQMFQI